MDELIRETLQGTATAGGVDVWRALAAMSLAFLLALGVALAYRETHRGLSYSVAFVHTMILMGVTVSIIMLIIGSNIARAFALVGALSIIRFRNAVKESRDVAFIFLTMAIGMATGTGFYMLAVVFTLFATAAIVFLHRFDIGAATRRERLLRVHVPEFVDYHTAFDAIFARHTRDHALLSVESLGDGARLELVYSIELKPGAREAELLDDVRAAAGDQKVVLLTGDENVAV